MKIETPFEVGDYVYIIRTYANIRIEREQVAEIGCDKKGQYVIIGQTRSKLDKFNKTFFNLSLI